MGKWLAQAAVTKDGCGERIAPVQQTLTLGDSASGLVVDTGLVVMPAQQEGDRISFSFQEQSGECVRTYGGELNTATQAVEFSSLSNCGGSACENTWAGTATPEN